MIFQPPSSLKLAPHFRLPRFVFHFSTALLMQWNKDFQTHTWWDVELCLLLCQSGLAAGSRSLALSKAHTTWPFYSPTRATSIFISLLRLRALWLSHSRAGTLSLPFPLPISLPLSFFLYLSLSLSCSHTLFCPLESPSNALIFWHHFVLPQQPNCHLSIGVSHYWQLSAEHLGCLLFLDSDWYWNRTHKFRHISSAIIR